MARSSRRGTLWLGIPVEVERDSGMKLNAVSDAKLNRDSSVKVNANSGVKVNEFRHSLESPFTFTLESFPQGYGQRWTS